MAIVKRKVGQKEQKNADHQWITDRLQSMTLPEKVGQMIFVALSAESIDEQSVAWRGIRHAVQKLNIGGLYIKGGDLAIHSQVVNTLQQLSATPLLLCADFERGVGERFAGAVKFPPMMALGAIDAPELTCQVGHAIAKESRAAGIPLILGPVVDVNTNPDNPVINIRSFGEIPDLVARHAGEFIRGAKDAGMLTTAKHFPGHGDVSEDSHLHVACSPATWQQLQTTSLVPFIASIKAGVDLVMSAHIGLPNVGMPANTPATLSYEIMTDLLRHKLEFQGTVITDSMDMWSISKNHTPAEAAARAVKAGADIILDVPDAEAAIQGILNQVQNRIISLAEIDDSVRRILTLKMAVRLNKNPLVDLNKMQARIGKPGTSAPAREVARKSLTLVQDEKRLLPLHLGSDAKILILDISSENTQRPISRIAASFQKNGSNVQILALNSNASEVIVDKILSVARDANLLLWNLFIGPTCYSGKIGIPTTLAHTLQRLRELRKPIVAISFGDPYIYSSIPYVDAYLCAYDESTVIQEVTFDALIGRAPISGKLPVTIPGYFKVGGGIFRCAT